ncbi:MAG TPA: DUF6152 family protein [Verrucomicrobiae bacterium]|jgi:hypothetical protein|nr:DUF6152 family protein [Verrucomicrobiae bacterium]
MKTGDTKTGKIARVAATAALSLLAWPVLAHHGASEYDMTKIVSVHASVTELQYVNPHTLLVFTVKDDSGKAVEWTGELPSPNLLSRRGWSRSTVKPGDQVTVIGAIAKNGEKGMQIKKLVFPDGHELPGTVLPPDSSK